MAHNVALIELHKTDALDSAHYRHCTRQTAVTLARQVNLRNISRHDKLRIAAHTRQEHLNLRTCGILRLIQNHKGVVQRTATHICKRRNLHRSVLQILLQLGCRNHIVQSVVQRLQIGV